MPLKDLIDVRLVVDGQNVRELRNPEVDDTGKRTVRYVEVKAGQTYSVVVRVLKGFKLERAFNICAELSADECNSRWTTALDTAHIKGDLQHDYLVGHFGETPAWSEEYGQWMLNGRTFGVLGTSEGKVMPEGWTFEDVRRIGSIRVEVFRAIRVPNKFPGPDYDGLQQPLDTIGEGLLKGEEIKANTNYVPVRACHPPQPPKWYYKPIKGKRGRPWEFVYLCRTRTALASLGMVERSASPLPDPNVRAERAERMADEAMEEIKRLKRELGRAGGNVKVKKEHSTVITTKRKRNEGDDDEDDEIEQISSLSKKPREVVVVDLTDD